MRYFGTKVLRAFASLWFGSIFWRRREIFHPEIRKKIATTKILAHIGSMCTARRMRWDSTNATMLFGHIEQDEHLIDHLSRLRALQDETVGSRR